MRWATHGRRRGIASETALTASTLEPVLGAGDWSAHSRAYVLYIASVHGNLGARAAAEALMEESDDEG